MKKKLTKSTGKTLAQSKITNDTVEKHKQAVLEKGKKFKYPVQYSKHKLVINALIVAFVVAIAGGIFGWYRLYQAQDTSDFMYRITSVFPLPVANIDGENVLYSDYLAQYRSNMSVTEKQEGVLTNKDDEKRRSDYYKSQSLDNAISNAYAIKLARENNITVSEDEINEVFNEHRKTRNSEISETAFNKIIEDNYKLSPTEYRRMFIMLPLLKQKVSVKIDNNALKLKDEVVRQLKSNDGNFEEISAKYGKKVEVSSPGFVKLTNIDGGRAKAAADLKKGEISEPFTSKGGDGYYIVKLLDKKDDEISYSYIKIPFTEFDKQLKDLNANGGVTKNISIDDSSSSK